jgi:hypothetical protein
MNEKHLAALRGLSPENRVRYYRANGIPGDDRIRYEVALFKETTKP